MREDDGVIQEFRAICCARVHKSFARAFECMSFARIAHLEGNTPPWTNGSRACGHCAMRRQGGARPYD